MDTELPYALRIYLAGQATVVDLSLYVAGFDIWNTWQDGEPEIEECRRIIAAVEHEALLVTEGASTEAALHRAIRDILAEDSAASPDAVSLTGDRRAAPR